MEKKQGTGIGTGSRLASFVGGLRRASFFRRVAESIRNKLLVSLMALALIPLVLLTWITYKGGSDALEKKAFDNLTAVQSIKSANIRTYFQTRIADMDVLVETVKTLREKAFNQLASMQELKKKLIENYFTERLNDIAVLAASPMTGAALEAFAKAGAVGGSEWKAAERIHAPFLVGFSENYGYYDLFLVSSDGKILYTAAQESDLGQNLKTGDLKDSPAGQAFAKGLQALSFQDFGEYGPAGAVPAAFISAPVSFSAGGSAGGSGGGGAAQTGVLMVQVSIDQINQIMQERTGLGETGGTYLIGADRLFRSDSVHVRESTVLNPAFAVDTVGVAEALAGRSGQGVVIDYRGEYVLSSWTPLNVHGVKWAMLAEMDVTEAFVPKVPGEEKDFFAKYREGYGYNDICLINPDGYLFYSVEKGKDFQTNLLTGPYKQTNLGRLLSNVLKNKAFAMADFEKYAPDSDAAAAFFAQPVISRDEAELVVAVRLSLEQINQIMQERTGLGETGETYLLGPDRLWRSDSRFLKELGVKTTVLNEKMKAEMQNPASLREALAGKSGTEIIAENYRGRKVLSSWSALNVVRPGPGNPEGVRWALFADIDYAEVKAPVVRMALYSILTVLLATAVIIFAALRLARGLTTQVNHITDLFGEIGIGNFAARTPVVSEDELGTMAFSLNAMLDNTLSLIQSSEERDTMQKSVMKLLTEISELAQGDLTKRAEVTEDFTGAIADSFNDMAEQIGRVVRNVKEATLQVSSVSQEVSDATEQLAETGEMQAVQVSDAIAAISRMAVSIAQVAANAARCTQVSKDSTRHAEQGAHTVRNTNAAMAAIREHVQETARAIKRLGESSQEIGNIVQLINDIADRTSILALNASIQAAMAGDAGRGFAVVAEEVQRLAERSTNATKQIDTLIKNIQGEIAEAGTSMEESIQRVVEGSKLADDALGKLAEIETVTTQLGELIQAISMASEQQAGASDTIAKTMSEVGEISSRASAASRQTAISMKNLAEISDRLNESVAVFKLEDGKEKN